MVQVTRSRCWYDPKLLAKPLLTNAIAVCLQRLPGCRTLNSAAKTRPELVDLYVIQGSSEDTNLLAGAGLRSAQLSWRERASLHCLCSKPCAYSVADREPLHAR